MKAYQESVAIYSPYTGIIFFFKIKAKNVKSKVRLYTTILCFTPENEEYRKYLIAAYDSQRINQSVPNLDKGKISGESPYLPFIIKKYTFPNAFSQFIHDSQHVEYEITGPIVKINFSLI